MNSAAVPFGQVIVALATPMTDEGKIHWEDVAAHINRVIVDGADGIVVAGTTGETSTLSDAEKVRLVEVCRDVADGRATTIMGGTSNETEHAVELCRRSAAAGAEGIMAVTPYYNKPTQSGVRAHFRQIADATPPARRAVRHSW